MNRDTMIEKLKADFSNGRVVTIVGTGISVAACGNQEVEGFKVGTWTGLLQHGVKHCKDIGIADEKVARLLNMQIESGEMDFLITAAETISQRMKAKSDGVFRGWLKDTIGRLKFKDRAVLDTVAALPGVLATLNYDNLLEDATRRTAVTWLKSDEVEDVLTRLNTNGILHLHGWYREPESVVLGLSSYLAVKDHPHAKAVLNLFAIGRTLLFIGCGDTFLDPNFTRLIQWGKEALSDVAPRHYLLCRTSEIGNFQIKLAGAPWLQPLDYGANYNDLVPFLRDLIPTGGALTPHALRRSSVPGFDITAYQQAMRKRYARLKLEELDPTTHDARPLTLTGMFIEQSARECAEFMPRVFELPKELQRRLRDTGELEGGDVDGETLEQHRRAYLDQSPRPILETIRDSTFTRLVVLGDPGSGKSTLLQYLLLDWSEKASPDLACEPLPLLIELREYGRLRAEGNTIGFLEYLHSGESAPWHFDQEELASWLRGNPSLILFDGLDEIFDPTLRREISTAIHRFAGEYPPARVIVTSRVIGYQHQAWRDADFRHFMLQDLDALQVAAFLGRWHSKAYEDPKKGEEKRALLARAIDDSGAIRELAGNPLLLTMMAILNRTQDLPRDRAELYEQCARLLLHQWKVDVAFSSYPELANASLDYKDKRGLLFRVARAMQPGDKASLGNLIDEFTLEATLADGMKGVPNLRPDRAARALIEQLRGRNFMLCSVGGRSYAFVHRTFLEYFCAVEIRERFQTDQTLAIEELKTVVFGHWANETWHEVLCLLAGMLAPRFVAEILEWLLTLSDKDDFKQIFLAADCLREVRKRSELGAIESSLLERVKELARYELPKKETEWGEVANKVSAIRARAVQAIARVWRHEPETRSWVKDRTGRAELRTVRAVAVREYVRCWGDDSETLPWLKMLIETTNLENVRWTAVEEIARTWHDDPETLVLLKSWARGHSNYFVRWTAMDELAEGWKDDPDTLPIIKNLVQHDREGAVRGAAVSQLASKWRHDPDTLTIFKTHARSDAYPDVRRYALLGLAHGWKGDPDTLRIAKEHAQLDKDPHVRASALGVLIRGWKSDPDTLQILETLAQSDAHDFVRRTARQGLARGWKGDTKVERFLASLPK